MRRPKVKLLLLIFRSGIKTSTLWLYKEEIGRLAATNYLSVYLLRKPYQDTFFVTRISYNYRFGLTNIFRLGDLNNLVPEKRDKNIEE